jgi:hypothetical protein
MQELAAKRSPDLGVVLLRTKRGFSGTAFDSQSQTTRTVMQSESKRTA